MGLRGPRPQPKALSLLKGTYRKDRGAMNQPEPVPEMPSCPPHLDDEAKKEWRRIGKILLVCGLLSKIDRAALAGYCQAWSDWVTAREHLKSEGLMTKRLTGHQQPSPWLSISNKALEQVRAFGAEFGLSPATRSRVEALPLSKAGDRAREARKQLLFGDGDSKLAKYLHRSQEDADREREKRFFGDDVA